MDSPVTIDNLAELVDVERAVVQAWIDAGLPCAEVSGEVVFDADEAVGWLITNGIASDPDEPVCRTNQELAQMLGKSIKTIGVWTRMPGFPGRTATPGLQNGWLPVWQIQDWVAENVGSSSTHDEQLAHAKADLLVVKCEERAFRLEQMRATLIEKTSVDQFFEKVVARSAIVLADLPDKVDAILPEIVGSDARHSIYQDMATVRSDVGQLLAELVSGDADEVEES